MNVSPRGSRPSPNTRGHKEKWHIVRSIADDSRARRLANAFLVAVLVIALYSLNHAVDHISSGAPDAIKPIVDSHEPASLLAAELDQRFLSRLVSSANRVDSAHQALVGEKPPPSKYTATIVIGRLSTEESRVQWVFDKLYNIQNPQIYIVDDNTTAGPHLDVNHGREAAVYMKYIVENYDNLPDISFFWHTDEVVWHNNLLMGWNSVEQINRMDRENIMRQGYVPSRCDHWPGCPTWITFNPSKAEHRLDPHRLTDLFTTEMFSQIFPELDPSEYPLYMAGTCCSQFALSRDQIHFRPKATYERLLNWAIEYEDDAESGRVFEYSWPFIFTGRGSICPSMQECYCKTYNFCIEEQKNIAALDRWNALRTRREEVQWQLKFFKDALETRLNESMKRGASEEELEAIQDAFGPELWKLNRTLENMMQTTWQAREDIIAYWKLPPPPVGW